MIHQNNIGAETGFGLFHVKHTAARLQYRICQLTPHPADQALHKKRLACIMRPFHEWKGSRNGGQIFESALNLDNPLVREMMARQVARGSFVGWEKSPPMDAEQTAKRSFDAGSYSPLANVSRG